MPTRSSFQVADYDNEVSHTHLWVQDMSAANFDSVAQDVDELKDAILLVSLGEVRDAAIRKVYPESGALVTDPDAQRERKWVVLYRDMTQFLDAGATIANPGYLKLFTAEIACADASLLATNSDLMDVSAGTDGETFVNSFEANARSPYNHTATSPVIEVIEIRMVGRNT